MGVLEALQQHRGLCYGPHSANHMAVVSGGSYVAAAAFLSAAASDAQSPPLAAGSAEAAHLVHHGRYLVEDGRLTTLWRFGWRFLVGVVASTLLFAWVAFIAADVALLLDYYCEWLPSNVGMQWLAFGIFLAGVTALGASSLNDVTSRRWMYFLAGLAAVVVGASGFVERVRDTDWLSEPSWLCNRGGLIAAIALAYACVAALPLVTGGTTRRVALGLGRNAPRVCLVVGTCWAVAAFDPYLTSILDENASSWYAVIVAGPIVGGFLASYVHDVVSMHRPYRDLVARCFGVRRTGSTITKVQPATSAKLSDLVPPLDPLRRHPRLLICATANVPGGSSYADRSRGCEPFILSHDYSGLAGQPNVFFETSKLEFNCARASVFGGKKEREVSLLGAVAMTGAAFAPTMGTMTSPALRPLIAFLNARLGVWLPNPLSPNRRRVVGMRPARPPRIQHQLRNEHGQLGPGGSAVISEILGVHSRTAKRIYVTDGGHYDNLGLLTLLRARCETIWCVDAYDNRRRLSRQLSRVVELAKSELGVTITIPTEGFALVDGSDHLAQQAFAIGEIQYDADTPTGRLIVIKSALTATSPRGLHDYRRVDKKFPYHSTLKQWYGRDRFENYRKLGYFHATEACAAV